MPINNYYFALDKDNNVVNSSLDLLNLFFNLITTQEDDVKLFNYQPLSTKKVSFKIINGISATGNHLNQDVSAETTGLQIGKLIINNNEYQIVNFFLPS